MDFTSKFIKTGKDLIFNLSLILYLVSVLFIRELFRRIFGADAEFLKITRVPYPSEIAVASVHGASAAGACDEIVDVDRLNDRTAFPALSHVSDYCHDNTFLFSPLLPSWAVRSSPERRVFRLHCCVCRLSCRRRPFPGIGFHLTSLPAVPGNIFFLLSG